MHWWKCAVCQAEENLTSHHVLPKRWYGKGKKNDIIVRLCQRCHTLIEQIINREEKRNGGQLKKDRYFEIVQEFIDTENEHA